MNRPDYTRLDRAHLWHPYTRRSAVEQGSLPLITRGEGIYLFDQEGNRYLDAIASWWSCSLGHSHPAIVEAIRKQAQELQHSILGNLSHPRAIELAARLAALMPDPNRHVMFASDGASAVEAALKMAIQYQHNAGRPAKTRFAYLQEAYHGDTLGAVSVGYLESFHKPFRSALFPAHALPVPEKQADVPACAQAAEVLIGRHAEELAALIVEPLCQCAAGMKMYPAPYLGLLAESCRKHGVLLIADEIATGFGRTGRMFAFEHAGVDPDIVCVGKALSAGALPISAAIAKDSVYETFSDRLEDRTFYHGHTYCGNPIAAAAALAALRVYEQMDVCAKARAMESTYRQALGSLAALPLIRDVRCMGSIVAVEFASDDGAKPPDAAAKEEGIGRAQQVRNSLLSDGILVRPLGNTVYLMPPLTMDKSELDTLLAAFRGAICTACSRQPA
ncbi:MAG: Adenosylmethionine-8-amino-7-oxononanoate aminotransferase [Verrucomicrobia bacterium ADurb.Bin345]|nr:MAG: Adenosylmethionine-8-amino-7-oxononanoate aminotransferase [Verrucomicrobia bacterium ADurb.Bin345]